MTNFSIISKISKLLGGCNQIVWEFFLPIPSGLLSLNSGSRKDERTELDYKKLTLCHAKVGAEETKALVSLWQKC